MSLVILHRSPRCAVIDKPAGLLSVPGLGPANQDCIASRVRQRFPEASGPITVHRLDMETSGAILVALVIGIAVSILQAVTQIQEMTLTFAPKLAGIALVLVMMGPWMVGELTDFTREMYELIPTLVN